MRKQMDNPKIKQFRKIVDQTDEKIIELLEKRFFLTGKIQKIKEKNNLPVGDLNREKQIIKKLLKIKQKVPAKCIKEIFKVIFNYSKKEQSNRK